VPPACVFQNYGNLSPAIGPGVELSTTGETVDSVEKNRFAPTLCASSTSKRPAAGWPCRIPKRLPRFSGASFCGEVSATSRGRPVDISLQDRLRFSDLRRLGLAADI
jgi:hypothetical protein